MCCNGGGQLLYIVEKLASFAALTAVVMCIIVTLGITLGLGIGLGYNYCFVDLKVVTEPPRQDEAEPQALRARNNRQDEIEDANTPAYRRSAQTKGTEPPTVSRRTLAMPGIKHTMAIPLHGDFDFPSLIAKLRGRNRNVTLELIT